MKKYFFLTLILYSPIHAAQQDVMPGDLGLYQEIWQRSLIHVKQQISAITKEFNAEKNKTGKQNLDLAYALDDLYKASKDPSYIPFYRSRKILVQHKLMDPHTKKIPALFSQVVTLVYATEIVEFSYGSSSSNGKTSSSSSRNRQSPLARRNSR